QSHSRRGDTCLSLMLHILLDSAPVGLLSNPARTAEVLDVANWAAACLAAGHSLYVPEVIDYEVRRELIRAGKTTGLARLDRLKLQLEYLPLTTPAMLQAAELWAQSRRSGKPTGDPNKIDIDAILAAQALTLAAPPAEVIVATPNARHLAQFVPAALWSEIAP
ncbi:MAG TPA: PIN domain-containing protein, partial [Armatimonadota bacterium]|nr:PIN domain-containing protein [Armatimonadota bacterium]